jgi:hypothetical protein
MATPKITFFPVGNGDMKFLELESGSRILVDINIRQVKEGVRDVAKDLRDRLTSDENGRPYVDAMVLSHPDQDHCRGLEEHFHLGPLSEYDDKAETKKIVIREMWSSPIIFRRASVNHTLSSDAKAWAKEARRRVKLFRENGIGSNGDRILILGEDIDGKTDGLENIVFCPEDSITKIAGKEQKNFSALLLAPLIATDIEDEKALSKNESSVIFNYCIGVGNVSDAVHLLSGGDAEVLIWEHLWKKHKSTPSVLEYDLLSTPHHCSWHSLSYDSWSEKRRKAVVSTDARHALAQARDGAVIVASSNEIKDDDVDPPCIRAKEEYQSILKDVDGEFYNTACYPDAEDPEPLVFEVTAGGLGKPTKKAAKGAASVAIATFASQPRVHG